MFCLFLCEHTRVSKQKSTIITYPPVTCLVSDLLVSPPPALYTLVNLVPCHSVFDKPHDHAQLLCVSIPALIVEEQHFVVRYASICMYSLEMPCLASRIDLQVVEEVYSLFARCGGWWCKSQQFKHLAREVRCISARGSAYGYSDATKLWLYQCRGNQSCEAQPLTPASTPGTSS